jgi:hypothetical protein
MCYIHYVVKGANSVKHARPLEYEAERIVRAILHEVGGFEVDSQHGPETSRRPADIVMTAKSGGQKLRFAIEAKRRITPQTALAVCQHLHSLPADLIPVIYAPVISPRVADIAKQQGVGFVDAAGNCWLRSTEHHLLIDRRGLRSEHRPEPGAVDPFSPKSSRIVRAMLSQLERGWKLSELAIHPFVDISMGLASKVKRALIEEGYAIEHKRLLYLRDPAGLLESWMKKYPGPAERISLYFRGDADSAEIKIGLWCRDHQLECAAAGFSAAWRLAPEVRFNVGALYLDERSFNPELLDQLCAECGGKRVDSGANVELWRPFDRSVFADRESVDNTHFVTTSALQTYLDLRQIPGRGEDAAKALFEKRLAERLRVAAARAEGIVNADV